MLESLLPIEVKITDTKDDINLTSNLNSLKTKKHWYIFFYNVLDFNLSHFALLRELLEEFIHEVTGTFKGEKPNNSTATNQIPLN